MKCKKICRKSESILSVQLWNHHYRIFFTTSSYVFFHPDLVFSRPGCL